MANQSAGDGVGIGALSLLNRSMLDTVNHWADLSQVSVHNHYMGEASPCQEILDLAFFNAEVPTLTGDARQHCIHIISLRLYSGQSG